MQSFSSSALLILGSDRFVLWETVLGYVRCLAAFLTFTNPHQWGQPQISADIAKGPEGGSIAPTENHSPRVSAVQKDQVL